GVASYRQVTEMPGGPDQMGNLRYAGRSGRARAGKAPDLRRDNHRRLTGSSAPPHPRSSGAVASARQAAASSGHGAAAGPADAVVIWLPFGSPGFGAWLKV